MDEETLSIFFVWERSLFILSVGSARGSSALLVLAGVLWGTAGLAGAMLQVAGGISPVSVAAYRLLVGGGILFLFVVGQVWYLRGWLVFSRLLVSGVLHAVFQAAYQVAVAQISVGLATLITIGCVPLFVAVLDGVLARRGPGRRTLLAIGGAVLGLFLLCGGAVGVSGGRMGVGVAMSLLAGAGFSLLTQISSRPVPRQQVIASGGLLLGGVFLLPLALKVVP